MINMQKDPYYSKKDTLRWHEASFQIIQVLAQKVLCFDYSSNHSLCVIIHEQYAKVKLKLQHPIVNRGTV